MEAAMKHIENRPSISVVISTYNRAEILSETLRSFKNLHMDGLTVEWVVVDNNSMDATPKVVQEFGNDLPIRYLFEPRPGKNCALNKALQVCRLGNIVVFTDDDITPEPDWLQQVAQSCDSHPEYSVFGGRVIPKFPAGRPPAWAQDPFIQAFAFARHDLGHVEWEYTGKMYPFGPNLWVRKAVLDQGFRYDENIGPRPKHRIMGSETKFLRDLAMAGYVMLYCPQASVQHRIQSKECAVRAVQFRAIRLGRGEVHLSGVPYPRLREKCRLVWTTYLLLKVGYAFALWVGSCLAWSSTGRLRRAVDALRVMGNTLESLYVSINQPLRADEKPQGTSSMKL
jgi:glycosyltransferase involved in cell wall biosynthesis